LANNDRKSLTSSDALRIKYQSDECKQLNLRLGKTGFSNFKPFDEMNAKWRFSMARNESGGKSDKAYTQSEGFVTNGFCLNNSYHGVKGRWFNVLGDALTHLSGTGDLIKGLADGGYAGTAHPNIYGQLFLAQRAWLAIPDELKKTKAITQGDQNAPQKIFDRDIDLFNFNSYVCLR
jgi:hypothetical protein